MEMEPTASHGRLPERRTVPSRSSIAAVGRTLPVRPPLPRAQSSGSSWLPGCSSPAGFCTRTRSSTRARTSSASTRCATGSSWGSRSLHRAAAGFVLPPRSRRLGRRQLASSTSAPALRSSWPLGTAAAYFAGRRPRRPDGRRADGRSAADRLPVAAVCDPRPRGSASAGADTRGRRPRSDGTTPSGRLAPRGRERHSARARSARKLYAVLALTIVLLVTTGTARASRRLLVVAARNRGPAPRNGRVNLSAIPELWDGVVSYHRDASGIEILDNVDAVTGVFNARMPFGWLVLAAIVLTLAAVVRRRSVPAAALVALAGAGLRAPALARPAARASCRRSRRVPRACGRRHTR